MKWIGGDWSRVEKIKMERTGEWSQVESSRVEARTLEWAGDRDSIGINWSDMKWGEYL